MIRSSTHFPSLEHDSFHLYHLRETTISLSDWHTFKRCCNIMKMEANLVSSHHDSHKVAHFLKIAIDVVILTMKDYKNHPPFDVFPTHAILLISFSRRFMQCIMQGIQYIFVNSSSIILPTSILLPSLSITICTTFSSPTF